MATAAAVARAEFDAELAELKYAEALNPLNRIP
jgi:hypothetical protein